MTISDQAYNLKLPGFFSGSPFADTVSLFHMATGLRSVIDKRLHFINDKGSQRVPPVGFEVLLERELLSPTWQHNSTRNKMSLSATLLTNPGYLTGLLNITYSFALCE
jgi:hypothetical protein